MALGFTRRRRLKEADARLCREVTAWLTEVMTSTEAVDLTRTQRCAKPAILPAASVPNAVPPLAPAAPATAAPLAS